MASLTAGEDDKFSSRRRRLDNAFSDRELMEIGVEGAWASVHNSLGLLEVLEDDPEEKQKHMRALKRALAQCGKSMGKDVGGEDTQAADAARECAQLRVEKREWEKREEELSQLLFEGGIECDCLRSNVAVLQAREGGLHRSIKTKDDKYAQLESEKAEVTERERRTRERLREKKKECEELEAKNTRLEQALEERDRELAALKDRELAALKRRLAGKEHSGTRHSVCCELGFLLSLSAGNGLSSRLPVLIGLRIWVLDKTDDAFHLGQVLNLGAVVGAGRPFSFEGVAHCPLTLGLFLPCHRRSRATRGSTTSTQTHRTPTMPARHSVARGSKRARTRRARRGAGRTWWRATRRAVKRCMGAAMAREHCGVEAARWRESRGTKRRSKRGSTPSKYALKCEGRAVERAHLLLCGCPLCMVSSACLSCFNEDAQRAHFAPPASTCSQAQSAAHYSLTAVDSCSRHRSLPALLCRPWRCKAL